MATEKKMNIPLILLDIGWRITVPLVVFVILGVYLDKNYGTTPLFLFVGIFLSLGTSGYAIYRTIQNMYKVDK